MKCKIIRLGNKHDTMRRNDKCKIEKEEKKNRKNQLKRRQTELTNIQRPQPRRRPSRCQTLDTQKCQLHALSARSSKRHGTKATFSADWFSVLEPRTY
jgi:acetyl-CoA carboxylase alpha subunit